MYNLDSSFSFGGHIWGWGLGCFYSNGSIYVQNSDFDSSTNLYTSINQLDDTGKTLKQFIYREIGFNARGSTFSKVILPTLDKQLVVIGSKWGSNSVNKSVGFLFKLNENLDTVFKKIYKRDTIQVLFSYVSQSQHDSSFYCVGKAYTTLIDSFLVVKYDKSGNFIWDKVFRMGKSARLEGCWFSGNHLFIAGCKETVWEPLLNDWITRDNYIIEMDSASNIINTHYFQGKSMYGDFIFNKYDENRNIFMGLSDTLLNPIAFPIGASYQSLSMTIQIGMLDSQNRYLLRTFIPMDTCADYGYRRWHIPYFVGRIRDGGVVCGGSKTDLNGCDSLTYTNGSGQGGWVMKLDSTGHVLWDRTYILPGRLGSQHYVSNFCEADNGDIICTGSILYGGPQASWLIRLDSLGRLSPTDSGFVGLPFTNFVVTYSYPTDLFEVGKDANEVLKLYPNPTTGYTHLLYNIHSQGMLNIYDIGGRRVKQVSLSSNSHEISFDISNLPQGNYIVECQTQNSRYSTRLVKE